MTQLTRFLSLSVLALFPLIASMHAQGGFTTVSGAIVDPNGIPWAGGTISAQLITQGGTTPTLNGQPFTATTTSGILGPAGNFTMRLGDNGVILPSTTTWQFTVSIAPGVLPPLGKGPQSFTVTTAINCGTNTPAVCVSNAMTITAALVPVPALSFVTSSGGGAPPVGNNGDLQMKNGTLLAASHINDNGTTLVNSENAQFLQDAQFCGPNPLVDIRCFGARPVSVGAPPWLPGITANCVATNTSVVISAASTFVNGDGVALYGCGAANGMTTPAAPTVTPSLAAAPVGTGYVVTAPAGGSTTTCYKVAARDKGQGMTPASPETCVTGQTPGQKTLAVTSVQLSNNLATATTAARSPEVLAVGMKFDFRGTTNDALFGGTYVVNTVPNNTTFTYQMQNDTRAGATSVAATGGTINYQYMNHVTPPAPGANVWQYYIYAGATGAETKDGVTQIVNSSLNTDPSYLTWDDMGSPYTTAPNLPPFVPTAAPSVATADTLVTTITAGAGTTTLTLANAPITSVSGTTILLDETPNIKATFTGAAASKGMVYVPAGCCYATNSILDVSAFGGTGVSVNGTLSLGDTLMAQGVWHGDLTPAFLTTPQFALSALTALNIVNANPGILMTIGEFSGFAFQVAGNAYNGVFVNGGSIPTARFDNCAFIGSTASDFSGVMYTQFTTATAGSNSAGVLFRNVLFNAAAQSDTPVFIDKNLGENNFDGIMGSGRGFFFGALGSGAAIDFNGRFEMQGLSMPFFSARGSNLAFLLRNIIEDTGSQPIVAVLAGPVTIDSVNSSFPSSSIPIFSGLPAIKVTGQALATGTATNSETVVSGLMVDGTYALSGTGSQALREQNTHVALGSGYSFFTNSTQVPAAPTCATITAGPPFPLAGTYTFNYFPVYFNGGWGVDSPSSSGCTVDGATQQITVTRPSTIPGAVSYQWFTNGNNFAAVNGNACVSTTPLSSWTYEGGVCGFSSLPSPPFTGGGPAGIINGNMWSLDHILTPTAAPTGTVNTTQVYMDSTTNWPTVKPNGNTAYGLLGMASSTAPAVQTKRVAGCATGAALGNTCDTTVTWTTAFPDTNYTVVCSGNGVTSGTPELIGVNVSGAQTAAAATVRTVNNSAAAAQFTLINCTAIHD